MPTPVAQAQIIVWLYSSSREPILIAYDTVQAKDIRKQREKKKKGKTATERNRKKESDKASERVKVRERKKEREKDVRLDGY